MTAGLRSPFRPPTQLIACGPLDARGVGLRPRNTVAPSLAGTPARAQTLTGTAGTWTGPAVTLSYQWQRRNFSTGEYEDIPLATTLDYVVVADDMIYGRDLRLRERATNAYGSTYAYSNVKTATFAAWFLANGSPEGAAFDNMATTEWQANLSGSAATVNGPVGFRYDRRVDNTLGADVKNLGAPGLIGAATAATYNTGSGVGTATRVDGSNFSYVEYAGLSANSWYEFDVENTSGSATIAIRQGAAIEFASVAAGSRVTVKGVTAAGGTLRVVPTTNAATSNFTVHSLKLLPGHHTYQATSANRPTLRGTPIGPPVFDDQFDSSAGWTLPADVTISGGKMVFTNTGASRIASKNVTLTINRTYRCVINITSITPAAANLTVRINAAATVVSGTYTTAGIKEFYFTVASTSAAVSIVANGPSLSADIELLVLDDVTADVVTAPYFAQGNGTNQGMTTPSINPGAVDSVFACAGVRKLSDAATGMVCELGPSSAATNGTFSMQASASPGTPSALFASRGTTERFAVYSNAVIAAPVTKVFSGIGDISSDTCILRADGAQVATVVTDQGTGSYTAQALNIGARNNASSVFFNGLIGCVPVIFATLADADRDMWEDAVSVRLTGAVIP